MAKSTTEKSVELQRVLDRFDTLIAERNISGLLPFLQNELDGKRAALKKHLLKARRHWNAFVQFEKEQLRDGRKALWGTRGDEVQCKMVKLAVLAVLNLSDSNNFFDELALLAKYEKDPDVRAVIDWAKPGWIVRAIEESFDKNEWFTFDYRLLRRLEANKIIEFSPRPFALSLAKPERFPFEQHDRELLQFLLSDPTVLERDIPLLFDYETRLHDRWMMIKIDDQQHQIWEYIFRKLLEEGNLDRRLFIEKSLHIQTKNWNNAVKLFFKKQLDDAHPTAVELIGHQHTLFSFLHESFSQVVNFGMEKIKQIHGHPDFDLVAFLDWLPPVLMRQDVSAAIKKALQILDFFFKNTPGRREELLAVAADVFVVPNLELQEQAAKRMLKNGQPGDAALLQKLYDYQPQMLGNIRQTLSPLMGEPETAPADTVAESGYRYEPGKYRLLEEPVTPPENWNEVLFLISRYLSGREPLDAELILNTFQTRQHLFPADFQLQLKPLFKQISYLNYPDYMDINNLMHGFLLQDRAYLRRIQRGFGAHNPTIAEYATGIFANLVRLTQRNMTQKSLLPLLCFPTHHPFWIEPKTLVRRLLDYQAAGEQADHLDLAIAISRMPREQVDEAIALLPRLNAEHRRLIEFCLGTSDQLHLKNETWSSRLLSRFSKSFDKTGDLALWAVAARTYDRNGYFPEFEQTSLSGIPNVARPFSADIDFVRHPKREVPPRWKGGRTEVIPAHTELSTLRPPHKMAPLHLLYSAGLFQKKEKKHWFWDRVSDGMLQFWASLIPQNPDPLAWHCIIAKSGYVPLLQVIRRPEYQWTSPLTFAFCMALYADDKPTRFQASEVLHVLIEENRLDATRVGEQLGDFVFFRFNPLPRLLECLESVKDVSPKHNTALFEVLDRLLARLYEQAKPAHEESLPTHFRKLVELFADLHAKTRGQASAGALDCLQFLKENPALKKLVAQLKPAQP